MGSTPIATMESLLNLPLLYINLEAEAMKTAHILHITKLWKSYMYSSGHGRILADMLSDNPQY
jgi:hypothetical protein